MRTQRERTIRNLNMHICATWECDDDGWPIVEPSYAVPKALSTFQKSPRVGDQESYCHFFVDDYRFERLWSVPEKYLAQVKRYAGAISPDFSLYMDMPYPMQMWNHYRTLALTMWWQQHGIDVVPTLNWSDEGSLKFCCSGLPTGGTFAVCTTGCLNAIEKRDRFVDMLARCCEVVMPDTLLMYGRERELGIDPSIDVRWYANDNHERVVRNAGHRDRSRLDSGTRK